ncbi:hypothetical protein EhV18_00376 [Emiliania huxleyi virus 18]|nr:hypothetical protein EhV18_00376 [Emiliania huxleyi virus 18]AHA55462.1 hypothetical protein EhV156_00367 [Emiliania huxleyi virus 156]
MVKYKMDQRWWGQPMYQNVQAPSSSRAYPVSYAQYSPYGVYNPGIPYANAYPLSSASVLPVANAYVPPVANAYYPVANAFYAPTPAPTANKRKRSGEKSKEKTAEQMLEELANTPSPQMINKPVPDVLKDIAKKNKKIGNVVYDDYSSDEELPLKDRRNAQKMIPKDDESSDDETPLSQRRVNTKQQQVLTALTAEKAEWQRDVLDYYNELGVTKYESDCAYVMSNRQYPSGCFMASATNVLANMVMKFPTLRQKLDFFSGNTYDTRIDEYLYGTIPVNAFMPRGDTSVRNDANYTCARIPTQAWGLYEVINTVRPSRSVLADSANSPKIITIETVPQFTDRLSSVVFHELLPGHGNFNGKTIRSTHDVIPQPRLIERGGKAHDFLMCLLANSGTRLIFTQSLFDHDAINTDQVPNTFMQDLFLSAAMNAYTGEQGDILHTVRLKVDKRAYNILAKPMFQWILHMGHLGAAILSGYERDMAERNGLAAYDDVYFVGANISYVNPRKKRRSHVLSLIPCSSDENDAVIVNTLHNTGLAWPLSGDLPELPLMDAIGLPITKGHRRISGIAFQFYQPKTDFDPSRYD